MNQTKIVATIGPASRSPEMLERLIESGVDVFRLNFSHGTHAEHSAVVADIRRLARERQQYVAILQDLCGPKMRLDPFPGDVVDCRLNDEFTIVAERTSDSPRELTCSYRALPYDLKTGERVLFADGTVAMTVTESAGGRARLTVTLPGRLRSRQGVNLPGTNLAVPSLTDKDLADLNWTAKHAADIDFVGLSFTRSAADVKRLRDELTTRKCSAHIIVKIEKPQAVEQLDDIVAAADGVMVARGDLGVEMDVATVPALQKRIIALCNRTHRPVITATQMLGSMEHSSRPTRAEASDVFNAVIDGTDAVMLSGESAVGEYPVEAVTTMRTVCAEAEAYLRHGRHAEGEALIPRARSLEPIAGASIEAATVMVDRLRAPLLIAADDLARVAVALSSRRPAATIVALVRTDIVARRLAVCWGITAIVRGEATSVERTLAAGVEWAKSRGLVARGEHAVLLRGRVADRPDVGGVLAVQIQ